MEPNLSRAYVVEILMVDGRPDGVRVATMDNWTGTGVAFSRFDSERGLARPELQLAGVYLLVGPDPDDPSSERLYVGEADSVRKRLPAHIGGDAKDFWTDVVVFSGGELNKAHVRWLEAELIRLARRAGRAIVDNSTAPPQQNLSEGERARVGTFLSRALQMLPLLGVSAFEGASDPRRALAPGCRPQDAEASEAADPSVADAIAVTLDYGGALAKGSYSSSGLRVDAGSRASLEERPSAGDSLRAERRRLTDSGVLVERDGALVFERDHLFRSPSGAASVLVGGNTNGHQAWRLTDGRQLGDLRQAV